MQVKLSFAAAPYFEAGILGKQQESFYSSFPKAEASGEVPPGAFYQGNH
jgi:hypothetical protein